MTVPIDRQKMINSTLLLLRRATGISYEMNDLSEAMYRELMQKIDITKPAAQNMTQINEIIQRHYATMEVALESDLVALAQTAVNVEPWLVPITPTKASVKRALAHVMPGGNVSTLDLIKRTKGVTISSVRNYAIQAYTDSWTHTAFKSAMKNSNTRLDGSLDMIARTSVNAVSNNTKLELYEKNSDLIDRVVFSAFLDSRTSIICRFLDMKAFKLKDAPVLPLHPNERSQLVSVLKEENINDVYEMLQPRPAVEPKNKTAYEKQGLKNRNGKIRKPSKTDRSPLKGTTTKAGNYEAWLRKQPDYYVADIVGVRAGKIFKKGAQLKDVINIDPITQAQLDKAIN